MTIAAIPHAKLVRYYFSMFLCFYVFYRFATSFT